MPTPRILIAFLGLTFTVTGCTQPKAPVKNAVSLDCTVLVRTAPKSEAAITPHFHLRVNYATHTIEVMTRDGHARNVCDGTGCTFRIEDHALTTTHIRSFAGLARRVVQTDTMTIDRGTGHFADDVTVEVNGGNPIHVDRASGTCVEEAALPLQPVPPNKF